jgi:hypothetical protein
MPIRITSSWSGGVQTIPQPAHCYECFSTAVDLVSVISTFINELGVLLKLNVPCNRCGREISAQANWTREHRLHGTERIQKEGVF